MKTQIIKDHKGFPTGVFIPMEDWEIIKKHYPNIEKTDSFAHQQQKEVSTSSRPSLENRKLNLRDLLDILD